jgi:hypothetical protein
VAKPPAAALALPKLDKAEKTLDVRLRLKGRAAVDLADYQKLYEEDHGESYDTAAVVAHILNTFIEADRAFQTRRKSVQPTSEAK